MPCVSICGFTVAVCFSPPAFGPSVDPDTFGRAWQPPVSDNEPDRPWDFSVGMPSCWFDVDRRQLVLENRCEEATLNCDSDPSGTTQFSVTLEYSPRLLR